MKSILKYYNLYIITFEEQEKQIIEFMKNIGGKNKIEYALIMPLCSIVRLKLRECGIEFNIIPSDDILEIDQFSMKKIFMPMSEK